ncbi:MAG: RNHCP domain-containing protein [Candidatus Taylorbacteria bacterium]|nr:RNHCP domain-containing protein [Candidatus Taylorbacteria bacterium]
MSSDTKLFQRTIEDFSCGRCGASVKGSGYTNHCPYCLWSKHVDIHPGDRREVCGGLMEPIGSETMSGDIYIIHKCVQCGSIRRKKLDKEDDFDVLVEIVKKSNEKKGKGAGKIK